MPAVGPLSGDGSDIFHLLPPICGAFFGTVILFYSFQRRFLAAGAGSVVMQTLAG